MLIIKIASEYKAIFTIQKYCLFGFMFKDFASVRTFFWPVKFSVGLLFSLQCWKSGEE